MVVNYATILNTLGLTASIVGSGILFFWTWSDEPTPSMTIEETAKAAAHFAQMEAAQKNFSQSATDTHVNRMVYDALLGPGERNKKRHKLNLMGFGLLLTGFALQFFALW